MRTTAISQQQQISEQRRLVIRRKIDYQVAHIQRSMKPGDKLSMKQMAVVALAVALITVAVMLTILFWGCVLVAAIPLTARLILPRQPAPRVTETARNAMQGQHRY